MNNSAKFMILEFEEEQMLKLRLIESMRIRLYKAGKYVLEEGECLGNKIVFCKHYKKITEKMLRIRLIDSMRNRLYKAGKYILEEGECF